MAFGVDGIHKLAWLLVLAGLLNGCARDSKPVQFYRLNADVGITTLVVANSEGPPLVGLGPIRIPEYLDRPQMVVAVTDNQYQLSEDHRWAERLDQNIALALLKSLPGQLGTDRIIRYPWPQRQALDYQVSIDILEFNVDAKGQSRLVAQWTVKRKDKPALDRRSSYQSPASMTDYNVMVKAQSQCLAKLGAEIAKTIRQDRDSALNP
ncbi:MAG: PqiC family protein [Methylococcales bacterium]|nr:PqiC family protein [Methylococcales bacterium]